jgi:hypothetical protein
LLLSVLVLLGVELAVRSVEPARLIDYVPNRGEQHPAVRDWLDAYGPASVSFVGSSSTLLGIAPEEVRAVCEAELGRAVPVGNYALDGAQTEDMESLARHLLRCGRPELLLVGLTPPALLPGSWDWDRSAYFWRLRDWWAELRRTGRVVASELPIVVRHEIGRAWATLRYRRHVPLAFRQLVLGTASPQSFPARGELAPIQLESPERFMPEDEQSEQLIAADLQRLQRILSRWRHGLNKERMRRLDALLGSSRAAGVEIAVFELPLNPRLLERYPVQLLDQFRSAVSSIAAANACRFVAWPDLGISIPPEHFRDFSHFNLLGARTFSSALTRHVIAPALRGGEE